MNAWQTTRKDFIKTIGLGAMSLAIPGWLEAASITKKRPNILFCISDDQSWVHTSATGCRVVSTPAFDRVAEEGVLFTNAFCAAPSCTPSRSAILTGQNIWRLEQGGVLFGALPSRIPVFTRLLEASGYFCGRTGKGWAPGNINAGGWDRDPIGRVYNNQKLTPPAGISDIDYSANFAQFLKERFDDKPFFFWFGAFEPHRGYERGYGEKIGKKPGNVDVPAFMPDSPEVRGDILDYIAEIEWYDNHLERMLKILDEQDELDNTIVIITSDNGMPFPRAKATLYDYGCRMPLAIRWGNEIKGSRVVDDMVSLADMAPTFLDVAGLSIPKEMTARSLKNVFLSNKSGKVDSARDRIFTARERHTVCRVGEVGYPIRAIRTYDYLYIRNFEPDRWPAGDPELKSVHGYIFGDVDPGPAKEYMLRNREDENIAPLFELAFGKRPDEELYEIKNDPYQMKNLAGENTYNRIKTRLKNDLESYLKKTEDPRIEGKSPWDSYPYYMGNPQGIVPYSEYQKSLKKE